MCTYARHFLLLVHHTITWATANRNRVHTDVTLCTTTARLFMFVHSFILRIVYANPTFCIITINYNLFYYILTFISRNMLLFLLPHTKLFLFYLFCYVFLQIKSKAKRQQQTNLIKDNARHSIRLTFNDSIRYTYTCLSFVAMTQNNECA